MKKKTARKIPNRSPDKTTLTISLPKEMKQEIERLAASESRTVSNYLVVELAKKLGITLSIALAALHFTRSPSDWSRQSIAVTGKAAWTFCTRLLS